MCVLHARECSIRRMCRCALPGAAWRRPRDSRSFRLLGDPFVLCQCGARDVAGLAGDAHDPVPGPALGPQGAGRLAHERGDRDHHRVVIDKPHREAGEAGHDPMHCARPEGVAVEGVVAVGGHAPDGVARVDVLHRGLLSQSPEVLHDPLDHVRPDLGELLVAPGVHRALRGRPEHLLPRALGHHHDGVSFLLDDVFEVFEAGAGALELHRHLRHQTQVH
mmetsp:Transcript_3681/g.8662  ORF Transcript_3681/g.8662 Transcript_3681/m.8662 type:complete len:220 (+) Transcript_3681:117-776(+)